MRYLVKTLGCKANLNDSQLIEAELQKRGWAPAAPDSGSEVDLCIVNSCTVTDEADKQSRKMAERLSRRHGGAAVVMTGCSAEVTPHDLLGVKGLNFVIGNRDKDRMADLMEGALARFRDGETEPAVLGEATGYEEMRSRHPMDREWPLPRTPDSAPFELRGRNAGKGARGGGSARTRAFLKVQEGCNSFCTFCVIPYGRGPSRSLRPREIVENVRGLVEQGVREIVITGTNIGQYGTDWNGEAAMEELVRILLADTDIERLRLSSLDPTEITDGMLRLMEADGRFCPHFHVSLQSPHSRILKLMKRRYGFDQVKSCLEAIEGLRSPKGAAFVGMDVITGFPGEGEDEFRATREALESLPWSRLHVFPYSERQGTPATRLPGAVHPHLRRERSRQLNSLSLERLAGRCRSELETLRRGGLLMSEVLMEGPVKGPDGTREWISGYTPNYLRVLVRAAGEQAESLENSVVDIEPRDLVVDRASGDVSFLGELA